MRRAPIPWKPLCINHHFVINASSGKKSVVSVTAHFLVNQTLVKNEKDNFLFGTIVLSKKCLQDKCIEDLFFSDVLMKPVSVVAYSRQGSVLSDYSSTLSAILLIWRERLSFAWRYSTYMLC